jgi:RNA polymerase subunit RPABC4/transcription elongation factor Spt4
MALTCPKCGRNVPDDAVYCPYCKHGLKPSASTLNVSVAGFLMLISATASLIIFLLSLDALLEIYSWYPQLIAQEWILYDQLFTGFSSITFIFGLVASILSLSRKSYPWFIVAGMLCTTVGGSVWVTSMLVPDYKLSSSFLYYFLPIFLPSLLGTLLVFPRRTEFK